jgi:hypothetical protein
MRSSGLTARLSAHGRETLRWELAASAAFLALALAMVLAVFAEPAPVRAALGHELSEWSGIAQGGARSAESSARQPPCMQLQGEAPHEWAAIAGASPTAQLHHQGVAGRGRTRFQPDTQTVFRLLRERQDAIITALTHRMRDASAPGAASHAADRPLLVTQPLRGPPVRG